MTMYSLTLLYSHEHCSRPQIIIQGHILTCHLVSSPLLQCACFRLTFYPQLGIMKCWLNNTPRSLCLCEKWELWNITWITPMVHRRTMLYLCTWKKSESPVFKQGLHLNSVLFFFDPKAQLSSFTTRLIYQLCLHSYNIVIRPTHAVVGHNSE